MIRAIGPRPRKKRLVRCPFVTNQLYYKAASTVIHTKGKLCPFEGERDANLLSGPIVILSQFHVSTFVTQPSHDNPQ
jgi:hypothetical protein